MAKAVYGSGDPGADDLSTSTSELEEGSRMTNQKQQHEEADIIDGGNAFTEHDRTIDGGNAKGAND